MPNKCIITNGKKFLEKKGRTYKETTCPANATEFDVFKAKKVLENNVPAHIRDTYYIETITDGSIIKYEDMRRDMVKKPDNDSIEYLISVIDVVEEAIPFLKQIPDLNQCNIRKSKLFEALSEMDLRIEDIKHWSEVNDPPAHIRCIVFTKLQSYQRQRRKIKKALNYVEGLIECHKNSSLSFSDIGKELEKRSFEPYNPRTDTWAELNEILMNHKKGGKSDGKNRVVGTTNEVA